MTLNDTKLLYILSVLKHFCKCLANNMNFNSTLTTWILPSCKQTAVIRVFLFPKNESALAGSTRLVKETWQGPQGCHWPGNSGNWREFCWWSRKISMYCQTVQLLLSYCFRPEARWVILDYLMGFLLFILLFFKLKVLACTSVNRNGEADFYFSYACH